MAHGLLPAQAMPASLLQTRSLRADPARGRPRIYLDHHATTPPDPRVVERMLPFFTEHFGNPASQDHGWGWAAAEAVEESREAIARFLNATADEIVFTGGATESSNLAVLGLAHGAGRPRHWVTTSVEHGSVLGPCRQLAGAGHDLTVVPVDGDGVVDPGRIEAALRPDTLLVSVQAANNEVGAVQPLADIGMICRKHGVFFHVDAAQSAAWLPIDVLRDGIDLLSLSAHKMHGPKGIGALFVARRDPRLPLSPMTLGGGQEHGLRPGTANVPGIVGFGAACSLVAEERDQDAPRIAALRDELWRRILRMHPRARMNGPRERLPNNLHVTLPGHAAENVIRAMAMRGVALSAGAACASSRREPSHVLVAMGRRVDDIHASLRFGLGRFTTAEEISAAADLLADILERQCQEICP